ncbi:MAG TPA: TadE/TadG family type IV pilus assembly protein [Terriglobales bacterium]|nr:TadE/TadG family type IV pilus assembly protein [Terriglobales bacterium]
MLHINFRQDWLKPLLRRLWQRADGTTALEFALVSPVLLLVSMGTLEIGMMMFNMITIEGGLREAARYGTTGQQTTDDRVKEIVDKLNQYAIGPVTIDKDNVSMKQYDSFSDVGKPEPYTDTNNNGQYDVGEPYTDINNNGKWDADQGVTGAGSGGEVVEYTVTYNWKILTPLLRPFLGSGGNLPLKASVVVENEPCPVSSATCSTSSNGWSSQ